MRRGAAQIELSLARREPTAQNSSLVTRHSSLGGGNCVAATVHRLSSSGKRLGEVPATWDATTGRLSFTARTDWDPAAATYLYEIVRD